MKKITVILSLIVLFVIQAVGQDVAIPQVAERTAQITAPRPMGGWDLLRKDWEKIGPAAMEYARTHTEGLQKTAAWGFSVGSTRSWWSTDLTAYTEFSVPSTCRAVGTHCYVFVADSEWGTRVTQAAVDSIEAAFDSRTPADPAKGIYELDTQFFGTPPDIDSDPRIVILIMDIRDGYVSGSNSGYVAGYFYQLNEQPQLGLPPGRHSNRAEIYYIDCNPGNLATTSGMTDAASTTAHEFQHMINYNYHGGSAGPNQIPDISFVNEGMSEAAMHLCGYDLDSPGLYFANTNVDFTNWSDTNSLPDYSRAGIFSWYLIEQFGSGLTSKIVQNATSIGIQGYNESFQKMGSSLQFPDVLKTFAVATELNDASVDPRYGFTNVALSTHPAAFRVFSDPNVSATLDTLQPYGTRYITFNAGTSLTITFTANVQMAIQAIATGPAGKNVSQVTPNAAYTVNGFGTSYSEVTFALTNLVTSKSPYQYNASGTGGVPRPSEISYDDGYPEGYYTFTSPDTAVVWFDAIPGAVLDSIKVAFRRPGSLQFGVWKYVNNPGVSPLGQRYGTGTIISTDSTTIPYPHPYPSWAVADLTGWQSIDMTIPIAIGFAFGTSSTAPGLMKSNQQYTGLVHSLTYTTPTGGTLGWYILSTNNAGDSVANYLVHAFVHYGTSGVAQTVGLTPGSYELLQNYPNPFNPETVIRYALPVKSQVSLIVFDLLGRQVASLVDNVQNTGRYEIRWDGKNMSGMPVVSGVYFYKLTAGNFTRTNKMVMIR